MIARDAHVAQQVPTTELASPAPSVAAQNQERLAIAIGFLVLALVLGTAVQTWRRGHKLLFVLGFFAPLAWLLGLFLRRPQPGKWI
jgi:hypothetical protein